MKHKGLVRKTSRLVGDVRIRSTVSILGQLDLLIPIERKFDAVRADTVLLDNITAFAGCAAKPDDGFEAGAVEWSAMISQFKISKGLFDDTI